MPATPPTLLYVPSDDWYLKTISTAPIIKNVNGGELRIRDIGQAVLGPENEETVLKESGSPMIALALIPQPGSNYVAIAEEFYKRFEQLKKDIPEDYSVNIAMDNTRFIKQSIDEVEETLIVALVLVIIIVYLFFRDWLMALRPLINIPVSLISALLYYVRLRLYH